MRPVQPPQRKGRCPQYARDKLVELQGIFRRPEDIGITDEYFNPSYLVKKTQGGYRLVTAFADVVRYSKPQPSLMPDVDSKLQTIAQLKYIIVPDLTKAFFRFHSRSHRCNIVVWLLNFEVSESTREASWIRLVLKLPMKK